MEKIKINLIGMLPILSLLSLWFSLATPCLAEIHDFKSVIKIPENRSGDIAKTRDFLNILTENLALDQNLNQKSFDPFYDAHSDTSMSFSYETFSRPWISFAWFSFGGMIRHIESNLRLEFSDNGEKVRRFNLKKFKVIGQVQCQELASYINKNIKFYPVEHSVFDSSFFEKSHHLKMYARCDGKTLVSGFEVVSYFWINSITWM